jgi:hypothetical protein
MYLISKNEAEFVELIQPERRILRQALGLDPEDAPSQSAPDPPSGPDTVTNKSDGGPFAHNMAVWLRQFSQNFWQN